MAGSPWAAPFVWSEENTQRLIGLWNSGKSGYEICKLMGITRNQVMGKLHRVGLLDGTRSTSPYNNEGYRMRAMEKMANKIAKASASPPTPSKGSAVRRVPISAPPPPPPPEKRPSTWAGIAGEIDVLRSGDCRWPIGDPVETFCKAPATGVYCPYHAAEATNQSGGKEWYEDPVTKRQYWR